MLLATVCKVPEAGDSYAKLIPKPSSSTLAARQCTDACSCLFVLQISVKKIKSFLHLAPIYTQSSYGNMHNNAYFHSLANVLYMFYQSSPEDLGCGMFHFFVCYFVVHFLLSALDLVESDK